MECPNVSDFTLADVFRSTNGVTDLVSLSVTVDSHETRTGHVEKPDRPRTKRRLRLSRKPKTQKGRRDERWCRGSRGSGVGVRVGGGTEERELEGGTQGSGGSGPGCPVQKGLLVTGKTVHYMGIPTRSRGLRTHLGPH